MEKLSKLEKNKYIINGSLTESGFEKILDECFKSISIFEEKKIIFYGKYGLNIKNKLEDYLIVSKKNKYDLKYVKDIKNLNYNSNYYFINIDDNTLKYFLK